MQITATLQYELYVATHKLLGAGLRTTLVQSMTGISNKQLRLARKIVNASNTRPTRTATNVHSYLQAKSTKPQSVIYLSAFVLIYNALEKQATRQHPAILFLTAWEAKKYFIEDAGSIDINAAWYAVRDTKSKEVLWAHCDQCNASFIWLKKATETPNCPYCNYGRVRCVEI